MKYMGSKNRIAKEILPIILKDRKEGQYYVEPFVGGCNMIDKVDGNRIGNDINFYLIELFKGLQEGKTLPDVITFEQYNHINANKDENPFLTGFVGFNSTYGGKWFGGYARGKNNKGVERNYTLEGKNNILKQLPNIIGIEFYNTNYYDIPIPPNSIIYCDPPYFETTSYKDKFDHDKFWQWCREKSIEGHEVYISEYQAPKDFECIKEVKTTTQLGNGTKSGNQIKTEKLFKYKG